MRRLLLAVVVLSMLSACSAMLLGGGSSSAPVIGSEKRSPAQITRDDATAAAIRESISRDRTLQGPQLNVQVRTGVVTLSGAVASFEIRDKIMQIVRNTAGVTQVKNQLQVKTVR